jgi:hypothetical protein
MQNGQIVLDTSNLAIEELRVKVIFWDEKYKKGSNLLDIFDILEPWEDELNTETIIEDIHKARVSSLNIRL